MTIQQHASFDSSAAELNATSKLVKAWESKNAKNAAKAGGISLMALSLAACGGSSTTAVVDTTPVITQAELDAANAAAAAAAAAQATAEAAQAAAEADLAAAQNPAGQSFALTSANDIQANGAGDDTNTGTSATYNAGDVITDAGGADTLNLTLTADAAAATVVNVETINASFNTFAAPTFAAANVSGASINITQSALGGSANGTVTGLGATNTVTFGAGITGTATVTVTGAATVNGGDAVTLTVNDAGTAGVTIIADDDTNTINLNDAAAAATSAASISAAGTVALDAEDTAGQDVELLTLSGNGAAVTYDMVDSEVETITVTGDQNVTIIASAALLDNEILTDSSTGTSTVRIDAKTAATFDLDRIAADVIEFGVQTNAAVVFELADKQNFHLTADTTALSTVTLEANVAGATAVETLNLRVEASQSAQNLIVSDFEVVNITVDDEAVPAADNTLTIFNLVGGTAATINVVSGDDNLTLTDVTADTIVGTGFNGNLIVTDNANVDTVTGGNGADQFSNLGTTGGANANSTFNGGAGNDTMTVDAADSTNRTVTFDGGAGTDTLSITTANAVGDRYTLTDVEVVTFTVDGTVDARDFSGATLSINGDIADGNETVTFSAANTTTVDLSGITINTGAGTVGGADTVVNGVTAVGTTITGTNGIDVITGGTGADTINGGGGADDIDGGAGADVINAGAGNDAIDGTSGSTITLGAGNDTLETLEGTTAAATVTITDFTMGAVSAAVGGDVIDLSGTGNTADGDLYATDDDSTITVVAEDSTAAVAWADNDVLALSVATFASYDTKAEVATLFGAAAEFSAFAQDEEATLFIAAADTGSTMVWALTESNVNTVISDAADTVSLVAVLEGVSAADLDIMTTANTIA